MKSYITVVLEIRALLSGSGSKRSCLHNVLGYAADAASSLHDFHAARIHLFRLDLSSGEVDEDLL